MHISIDAFVMVKAVYQEHYKSEFNTDNFISKSS